MQTHHELQADAFLGPPATDEPTDLWGRVAQRLKRRSKPERLVEGFLMSTIRAAGRASLYVAAAYFVRWLG